LRKTPPKPSAGFHVSDSVWMYSYYVKSTPLCQIHSLGRAFFFEKRGLFCLKKKEDEY
jgi:hypothetical protein